MLQRSLLFSARGSTATTSIHPYICQGPSLRQFSLHSRRSTRACLPETVSSNKLTQREKEPKICFRIFKCFSLSAFIYVHLLSRILFFPFIALLILIHPCPSLLFWKTFPDSPSHTLCHLRPLYVFLLLLITLYYNLDGRDQVFLTSVSPVSSKVNNKLLNEQMNKYI